MICTNELLEKKCNKRKVLEPLIILISAYAPHIAEELWSLLGHDTSVVIASFPTFDEKYLKESSYKYPISFNGKTKYQKEIPLDLGMKEIEELVLQDENVQRWLDGKTPKKVIVVPRKIVNIVC